MSALDEGDLQSEQVEKIAKALQVPENDVISMNRRLASPDHSLNAPVRADSEGEWQDWLVDDAETQESELADREDLTNRRMLLGEALKGLNERERHILIERRLKDEPTTLEELSQQYNISRERVRQIEVRAFEKLQKGMKTQIVERPVVAVAVPAAPLLPRRPDLRAAAHLRPGHGGGADPAHGLRRGAVRPLSPRRFRARRPDPDRGTQLLQPHGRLRGPLPQRHADGGGRD